MAANSASAICPHAMTEAGADETLMTLNGAYRPRLAGLRARLDRIGLRQVATTIRSLLGRVAEALADPAPATEPAPWSSLTDRRRKTARLDGDDCS